MVVLASAAIMLMLRVASNLSNDGQEGSTLLAMAVSAFSAIGGYAPGTMMRTPGWKLCLILALVVAALVCAYLALKKILGSCGAAMDPIVNDGIVVSQLREFTNYSRIE